jgi:antitoxin MazE
MKTTLVRIGNSQGIRIPKPFIEQCGFRRDVDLDIRGRDLV